jgi:hypothetical protein
MSNPLQMSDQANIPDPDPDAPVPYTPTGEMPAQTFLENPPQPPPAHLEEDEEE